MSQEIMVIGGEPVLTRTALVAWNEDGTDNTSAQRTFALIPENWLERDLEEHPADELIFYWLDAYEWIRFAAGDSFADDWTVIAA